MKKENYIEKNFRKVWSKPCVIIEKTKITKETSEGSGSDGIWYS